MIQAIVLDVDGVIVGEKVGFNSPYPHPTVTSLLKDIREKDIPIILCTAKPYKSILKIIENASLRNVHITDAGGVLYDPIDNIVFEENTLGENLVKDILKVCLRNQVYTEFYTLEDYYIQKDQECLLTQKHTHILQFSPIKVPSLVDESQSKQITKIMPIAQNEEDRERITKILNPYKEDISLSWGYHPYAGPFPFGIITNKNVSKKTAVQKVIQNLNVPFEEVLAVGDSTSDWQFMNLAGYVGTLENAKDELKELVKEKGEGNYFIGKSVDENGILDILNYFIKS